jgi:hypothetical protein
MAGVTWKEFEGSGGERPTVITPDGRARSWPKRGGVQGTLSQTHSRELALAVVAVRLGGCRQIETIDPTSASTMVHFRVVDD